MGKNLKLIMILCYMYNIDYLQVRANPPIRIADWSGDKNLYCTANITTCFLCVLCHTPSLLQVIRYHTRAHGSTENIAASLDMDAEALYFSVFHFVFV